MMGRQVALYFAWSRPDEVAAPLGILEDRFPALFELRRMSWPRFEQFADPVKFDQGVGGFLDNIQLANFKLFADLAASWTGNPVRRAERRTETGLCALDGAFLAGIDTLVVMSFDSSRTQQQASDAEIGAISTRCCSRNPMFFAAACWSAIRRFGVLRSAASTACNASGETSSAETQREPGYNDSSNVPLRGMTQRSGRETLLQSPHFWTREISADLSLQKRAPGYNLLQVIRGLRRDFL